GNTAATAAAKTGSTSTRKAATTTAATITFSGKNHLQQLIRVFEKVLELITLSTQDFCGQLCADLDAANGRIFRNITNLVYFDGGFSGERGFQLLGKRSRLCIACWKSANKPRKLRLIE